MRTRFPLASMRHRGSLQVLRDWMNSYKPETLFTENGAIPPRRSSFMPKGDLRLGANPNANGGAIRRNPSLTQEVRLPRKGHGFGATEGYARPWRVHRHQQQPLEFVSSDLTDGVCSHPSG